MTEPFSWPRNFHHVCGSITAAEPSGTTNATNAIKTSNLRMSWRYTSRKIYRGRETFIWCLWVNHSNRTLRPYQNASQTNNLYKYMLPFGQIHLSSWTNTYFNLTPKFPSCLWVNQITTVEPWGQTNEALQKPLHVTWQFLCWQRFLVVGKTSRRKPQTSLDSLMWALGGLQIQMWAGR